MKVTERYSKNATKICSPEHLHLCITICTCKNIVINLFLHAGSMLYKSTSFNLKEIYNILNNSKITELTFFLYLTRFVMPKEHMVSIFPPSLIRVQKLLTETRYPMFPL